MLKSLPFTKLLIFIFNGSQIALSICTFTVQPKVHGKALNNNGCETLKSSQRPVTCEKPFYTSGGCWSYELYTFGYSGE
jgi:hypothetical protein